MLFILNKINYTSNEIDKYDNPIQTIKNDLLKMIDFENIPVSEYIDEE